MSQTFDAVLEFALLGLFLGVSGYAVRLILTTVRGENLGQDLHRPGHVDAPAPHSEAPGRD